LTRLVIAIASFPLEDLSECPRQPPRVVPRRAVPHRQVRQHQPGAEHAGRLMSAPWTPRTAN